MNIKIFSENNFLVVVQENQFELSKTNHLDIILEEEKCFLKFFPLNSNRYSLPFCLKLENKNRQLKGNLDNIKIYHIKNCYEIFVEPKTIYSNKKIQYEKINYTGGSIDVSIYENYICFEGKNYCESKEIEIKKADIEYINGNIFVVGENKNTKLCCNFNINSKQITTLEYEQIEKSANNLKILSDKNTIAGHKVLTTFTFDKTGLIQNSAELYYSNNPKLSTKSELIPFMFLESLKIDDTKHINSFLSHNLQSLSKDTLSEFFGDYNYIRLSSLHPIVYTLYGKSAKQFEFNINNNIIFDINEI